MGMLFTVMVSSSKTATTISIGRIIKLKAKSGRSSGKK